jgi:hypothetical protein
MPKVQHKPIKRLKLGFKRKEQKKPKGTLVWRTGLSGVPPDSVWCPGLIDFKLATFGFLEKPLRYNSPDCPVCHRTVRCASGATTPSQRSTPTDTCKSATVRGQFAQSQSSARRRTGQWTVPVRCPKLPELQRVKTVRTLTVRWCGWRTGLSGAPIDNSPPQRLFWWLGL